MKDQRAATFAQRLQAAIDLRGMSKAELAEKSGVSKSSITHYVKGDWEGKQKVVYALSEALNVSEAWLMGWDVPMERHPLAPAPIPPGFQPMPEMSAVPLVGSIACGTPILAEQNIEARIGVPALWQADFALTCHGNSMAAMIQDGDIVCIRKQPEVENGEIAAVRIGEEATLKRFYRQGDTVMLQAENPAFSPLVYTRDQLNEITLEGRVVGICRGI